MTAEAHIRSEDDMSEDDTTVTSRFHTECQLSNQKGDQINVQFPHSDTDFQ